jgi:hypothetical protein
MEKEYAIKSFICILIIFIALCFMPWNIDTDIKRYSVQEIDSLINEEYFLEKLRNDKSIQDIHNQIEELNKIIQMYEDANKKVHTEYNDSVIRGLKETQEICMYYINTLQNTKREDIYLTDDKTFERKVHRGLLWTRILTALALLYFCYKLYKLE